MCVFLIRRCCRGKVKAEELDEKKNEERILGNEEKSEIGYNNRKKNVNYVLGCKLSLHLMKPKEWIVRYPQKEDNFSYCR